MPIFLKSKGITNIGNMRRNEDSIRIATCGNTELFILADGLGGHGHGEVASNICVNAVVETFLQKERLNIQDKTALSFRNSQKQLIDVIQNELQNSKAKSTLVVLAIERDKAFWGHIGDSRLYMFSGKALKYMTKDHSVPQALVQIGRIKPADIRNHEDRNRLLKVVGSDWQGKDKFELLEKPIDIKSGDAFLLCSDGFWELITEKEMLRCLENSSEIDDWLLAMKSIVEKKGIRKKMDNYSAIVVKIG